MTIFEQLSPLDQEKIKHDASVTLIAIFSNMHEKTGWCGDVMPEYWNAAYPILLESLARAYRPATVT